MLLRWNLKKPGMGGLYMQYQIFGNQEEYSLSPEMQD